MSSQNYYFCSLCIQPKSYNTFRKLFQHIRYVRNGDPNFKIRSELGPLCGTIYSTFSSYKAHIYREHTDLINEHPQKLDSQSHLMIHGDERSTSTDYDTTIDFHIELDEIEDEENETEEEADIDDIISWQSLKEKLLCYQKKR